jgi:hypothetical protein
VRDHSGENSRTKVPNVVTDSTVKFRQPFDLIALGATELKQKKAAGMGSDDLYQFKYTWVDAFRTFLCSNAQAIAD